MKPVTGAECSRFINLVQVVKDGLGWKIGEFTE